MTPEPTTKEVRAWCKVRHAYLDEQRRKEGDQIKVALGIQKATNEIKRLAGQLRAGFKLLQGGKP